MTETGNWAFPPDLQPKPEDLRFDLATSLDAVVALRAEIPDDAFTAPILGTQRQGSGVVIREDGLVLTIGYLIVEAETVWLTSNRGDAVAAHPLAYDPASGFGLVQPLGRLGVPALERGSAASCAVGDGAVVIGHGGRAHTLKATLIDKREFAGYWEYVLDEALFTAPAHPEWSGTALVDVNGRLLGIGSLLVEEAVGERKVQGNMFVPIDLIEPILDDMLTQGRPGGPARPWLGMYTMEANGQFAVGAVAKGGPADRAGVRPGDAVLEVEGERPSSLADLFRRVWRCGPAGTEVALAVVREGKIVRARLRSADRNDFFRKRALH